MDSSSPQNNNRSNPKFDNFGIAGKSLISHAEAQGTVYQSFKAANAPAEVLDKADIKEDIAALHKEESIIPTLRTYESDVAEAIKQKQTTVIHIAVEEKKKEIAQPKPTISPKNNESNPISINILILFLSIFLIVGGLAAVGLLIFYKIKAPRAVTVAIEIPKIISTESIISLIIPPDESPVKTVAIQKPKLQGIHGSLTEIRFTTGTSSTLLSAEEFITRLSGSVPTWLSASFAKQFAFGYQILDTPQPFLIFKTNSYDNAFAGMLKWETTFPNDFLALDIYKQAPSSDISGSTTSPVAAQQSTYPTAFQDTVINNKDVRILYNSAGKPLIVYSVPDKQTIIITTNIITLKEIFSRLTTSRFVQ